MTDFSIGKATGAAPPSPLHLWLIPVCVCALMIGVQLVANIGSVALTMVAALAIFIVGVPHGTLDIEIAAIRFGQSTRTGKAKILAGYIAGAALMALCWVTLPELALTIFLVMSVIHFGEDWRDGPDPFLGAMVGWALIALPALSHPQDVAVIFALLTGGPSGATVAALLACTAAPALIGSLVFAGWVCRNGQVRTAVDVVCCLLAAVFLPPLIAFAIYFCALHSPRHMAAALRETADLSAFKRASVIGAVFLLSAALAVLLFAGQTAINVESGIIRAAVILISILTVPHFILDHLIPPAQPSPDSTKTLAGCH